MNPYAKGLSDAVMGQSAPTSAGKVGTHFNSPYMKAISQNLMTAIYGSPQDDLTRQRIEASKAQMANYNSQVEARDLEGERNNAINQAWASKDYDTWVSLMGPEAFGKFSSGGSTKGSGGSGGAGGVDSKDVLKLNEMAAEFAKANIKGYDKLKHAERMALHDDIAQSFHQGNFTPSAALDYDDGGLLGFEQYGYRKTGPTDYWQSYGQQRDPVQEWFFGNSPVQGGAGGGTAAQLLSQGGSQIDPSSQAGATPVTPPDPRAPTIIGSGIDKVVTQEIPRGAKVLGNALLEGGEYLIDQLPDSWNQGVDNVFDGIEVGAEATGDAIGSGYDYLANTSAGQWLSENVGQPIADAQSRNGPNYSMIAPATTDDPSIGERAWDGTRQFVKDAPSNIADIFNSAVNSPYAQVAAQGVDGLKDMGAAAQQYGLTAQHEELLRLQQEWTGPDMPQEYAIPVGSQQELDAMKADGRLPRNAYYAFDGKLRQYTD